MAKRKIKPRQRGINGWYVLQYETGPLPESRQRDRWHLYRCYDKRGRLLYVGWAQSLSFAFAKHQRRDMWHKLVKLVIVVEFRDETTAKYAEYQTCLYEVPMYNPQAQLPVTKGWDEETIEEFRARPTRERDKR